jgi:RimJ/RimL family protein N-acetyltransferase
LATELLAGFVGWCRARPTIHTVTAGVATTNRASRRVLERLGFVLVTNPTAEPDDELLYRLAVAAN